MSSGSNKTDTILKVSKGSDPRWVGACLDLGNEPEEIRYIESAKLASDAYYIEDVKNTRELILNYWSDLRTPVSR